MENTQWQAPLWCADDYGLHPAINQAILSLLKKQRIQATSCITNIASWPAAAPALRQLKQAMPTVQIGLHLNLTEPANTASRPLKSWIMLSHSRLIRKKNIYQNLEQQYNDFIAQMGQAPDFIDGHEHIHILPVIRDALIQLYKNKCLQQKTWIRLPWQKNLKLDWPSQVKAKIIANIGTKQLSRLLSKNNIAHNQHFAGIYDFKQAHNNYASYADKFQKKPQAKKLIMCHPANAMITGDAIAAARVVEYQYLISSG